MVVWGRDFGQIVSSVYYPSSKFGAIIHSRSQKSHRQGSRFLTETRDRPSSSLSLTLSFVSLATSDHAKFPNSCHHDIQHRYLVISNAYTFLRKNVFFPSKIIIIKVT